MMLKKFLKIAVALPLATILIVASSGLTIFLHHCDCEGKTEISIYSEVGCDMHTTNKINERAKTSLENFIIINYSVYYNFKAL